MALQRFGTAAFDPATILRIDDYQPSADGYDEPPEAFVEVYFTDGKSMALRGANAAAVRAFVAALPDGAAPATGGAPA